MAQYNLNIHSVFITNFNNGKLFKEWLKKVGVIKKRVSRYFFTGYPETI